jgi:alpha-galactosidase
MIRVAIIGAGSVEFTRNVVADLCSFRELAGQVTIALHDGALMPEGIRNAS